ncbi:hypothetical protein AB1Y20_020165 [Prymnesium parvum]|uniref:DDB1- and CUL4-associated factor 15 WD40 repeat-containing domain-containing protein n=1 Tax=Prymnesium parvum TaxID=97485 RepID=A0AB34JUB6_PRYPA
MAAVDTLLHDNLHTRLPYARPPPARQARPLEPRPLIPRRAYACDAAPPFPLPAPPCPPPAASANCVSVLRGEAAPALAHARGPAMRTVALRAVEPDGCPLLHELPLPHRVRQLAAGEPSAADCTLAARTEARVHFLSHRPAERALRAGPLLSPAAPPLHLALNPSLRGEAACLLASLELHTYDLARLPPDERPAPPPAHRLALAPAAAPSAGGAVEFGAHPRTLYTLTDGAVRLIDLRQPPPPPEARRLLFDARRLPLADGAWDVLAVPRGEHGSPLLSLCSHGHLLLLDARSARAPVLQWRLPIPLCAEAAALSPRSFVEFCGAASIHLTERSSAACLCFEFGGGRGSGALPLPAPQMPTSLDARRSLFQHLVYGDVCADVPSFPLAGAAAFELGDGGGVELGVLSCGGALLRLSRAERGGGGGGGGARLADAANGAWEAPQRDELGVDAVASRRLWEEVWRRPVVEEGANDEAAAAAGVLAVTASEAAVDEQMVAALRGKWDAWQQSDFSELAVGRQRLANRRCAARGARAVWERQSEGRPRRA